MREFPAFTKRTAARRAMRADGLRPDEVAELSEALGTLAAIEGTAPRRRRRDRHLTVSATTFRALRPAAEQRGIAVSELAARILETAAAERLIDAVLDDGRT